MSKAPRKPAVLEVWKPAPWDVAEVAALQSLSKGEAGPHEQKRALAYIVNILGMTYEHTYFPSDRDTAFANGRRYVGLQIVKALKLDLSEFTGERKEPNV